MARIRTVKPEFWTSEQIVECSTNARLLFIGLWNFCDDSGVHPANVMRLKMEVFPADGFTRQELAGMVQELLDAKLLSGYLVEGQEYWRVTGWRHQKIDRPGYKYPLEDGKVPTSSIPRRFLDEHSTSIRRVLDEHSPPEGKGREGKVREEVQDRSANLSDSDCGIMLCRELSFSGIKLPRETAEAVPTIRTTLGFVDNWQVFDFVVAKWRSYQEATQPKYRMKYETWLANARWKDGERVRINGVAPPKRKSVIEEARELLTAPIEGLQ